MATAKYTILVPTRDELGNQLALSSAAHHYLTYGQLKIQAATVHPGSPFDSLAVWADDTPEADSTMKQTAVYVGELANAAMVVVTKEGKSGATWQMRNPHYQPGMPSETAQPIAPSPAAPSSPLTPAGQSQSESLPLGQ